MKLLLAILSTCLLLANGALAQPINKTQIPEQLQRLMKPKLILDCPRGKTEMQCGTRSMCGDPGATCCMTSGGSFLYCPPTHRCIGNGCVKS